MADPTIIRIKAMLKLQNLGFKLVYDHLTSKGMATFRCKKSHIFKSYPRNVFQTGQCPECERLSATLHAEINKILTFHGIRMVGKSSGYNCLTQFECCLGHKWSAKPGKMVKNPICPECKEIGFNPINRMTDDRTKVIFHCEDGHSWAFNPQVFGKTSNCPICGKAALS